MPDRDSADQTRRVFPASIYPLLGIAICVWPLLADLCGAHQCGGVQFNLALPFLLLQPIATRKPDDFVGFTAKIQFQVIQRDSLARCCETQNREALPHFGYQIGCIV